MTTHHTTESVERLAERLGVDVFYGDERMHKLSKHNPLHLDAIIALRDLAAERDALRARLDEAEEERERLAEILRGIEMLTATGQGLDAEQTMTIHLISAEGRADDPQAWRIDPAVIERFCAFFNGSCNGTDRAAQEDKA